MAGPCSLLCISCPSFSLHHPVVLYEDKILDGRNRVKACEMAGVAVTTEEYEGDDEHEDHIDRDVRASGPDSDIDEHKEVSEAAILIC